MDVERLPAFLNDVPPAAGLLALTGGRVLDELAGDDGTPGAGFAGPRTVLVRDGRFEAVIAPGDGVPDGAVIEDVSGMTLLPGLIDARIHVSMLDDAGRGPRPARGAEPAIGRRIAR